jgi:hypothetical protein
MRSIMYVCLRQESHLTEKARDANVSHTVLFCKGDGVWNESIVT